MRDCSQGLNSQEMRRSITIQRRLPSPDFVGHVGRKNPGFDDFSAAMYADRLAIAWTLAVLSSSFLDRNEYRFPKTFLRIEPRACWWSRRLSTITVTTAASHPPQNLRSS